MTTHTHCNWLSLHTAAPVSVTKEGCIECWQKSAHEHHTMKTHEECREQYLVEFKEVGV